MTKKKTATKASSTNSGNTAETAEKTETTKATKIAKKAAKKTSKKTAKATTKKTSKKTTKKAAAKKTAKKTASKKIAKTAKKTTRKTAKKTAKKTTTKKVSTKTSGDNNVDLQKDEILAETLTADKTPTTSSNLTENQTTTQSKETRSNRNSSKRPSKKRPETRRDQITKKEDTRKAITKNAVEEKVLTTNDSSTINEKLKKPTANTQPISSSQNLQVNNENSQQTVVKDNRKEPAQRLEALPGEKISGGLLALEQAAAKEKTPKKAQIVKAKPAPKIEVKTLPEKDAPIVTTIEQQVTETATTGSEVTENGEKELSKAARKRRNYRKNKRKRLQLEREAAEAEKQQETTNGAVIATPAADAETGTADIETGTADIETGTADIETGTSGTSVTTDATDKIQAVNAIPVKTRKETGRNMLMNVVDPGEIRVAIAGKKGLEEIYIEKSGGEFVHGNIFKGVVENVEPNLQAAFVNIGAEKNGFLHVRDVIYPFGGFEDILGTPNRQRSTQKRPPINHMLQKGQEILVQITREQVATKGPSLTTYISLPGRYLVLMPAVKKRGVSRKITNRNEREELRKALEQLDPPNDMGYIIRTAGMGKGKDELQRDLDYLTMLWEAIAHHTQDVKGPIAIYQESDLVIRAIRDYFTDSIDTMIIDSEDEFQRAQEFLKLTMPEDIKRASFYNGNEPLFSRYNVEDEISGLFSRSVRLKSGGELIIEQTEAMVTIDINTGRFLKGKSSHDMVLKINKEAAIEVAKQLRLRDMGGLVMIDFIDMESEEDRRNVENTLRSAMQIDRAKVTMLPISQLGVMEMTRQRMRQSLGLSHFSICPHCAGTGVIKNTATLETEFLRSLRYNLKEGKDCKVKMNPISALEIANKSRLALADLEREYRITISIIADASLRPDKFLIK